MDSFRLRSLPWSALVVCSLCLCGPGRSAETNALNTVPEPAVEAKAGTNLPAGLDAELQLRTYLKLQEQLHATLLAIEQARQDASDESKTHTDALATRLELLEQSLIKQREQQWQSVQDSNRTMLVLAGSVIGLGLLALIFTLVFQSRGMNRLAEIATTISQDRDRSFAPGSLPPALGHGEHLLLGNGGANASQRNLLATVERLQDRIQELERTAHPEPPFTDLQPANPAAAAGLRPVSNNNGGAQPRPLDHAAALVGKAQVLLRINQVQEALACYDEALAEAPHDAETHLRRGQALEKLKRYDEALASYDQALALNRGLTQAYLCKGAVFNEQERYAEALACYEQALHTETKASPPLVST